MQLSRRTVLLAGAGSVTAACRTDKAAPRPVDPDVPIRAAALLREQDLLATYAAVLTAHPRLRSRLQPLMSDHAVHVTALGGQPSATQVPAPPGDPVRALLVLERTSGAAHGQAAAVASRRLAPLLASLAAACSATAILL